MAVEVPIRANIAAQTFDVVLNGISYTLTAKWNSRSEIWFLDIQDEDGNNLILGVALKLGARLLKQFNLGIGDFIMVDDTATNTEANLSNISVSTRLVYFAPDEIAEIEALQ